MARDEFEIEQAARDQALLRLLLQGPSGGGKTTTALLIARGMVKALGDRQLLPSHLNRHVGVICTERGSARKAAHIVPFDLIVLSPPYTVARYLACLGRLERVGYPVIIIDQITHEWSGEGGILAQVSAAEGKNDFAKWNGPSQAHEEFIDRLLISPAHLICTARAKTEYVLEEKEVYGKMKKVPVRIGMQAKQREGTEFEFDTVLDLTPGTNAVRCIKDRCELFVVDATVPRLGVDAGVRLVEWIYSAPVPIEQGEGPSPEERARAMCDASIRAVNEAPNLPDLVTIFGREQTKLREFATVAGAQVMKPLVQELVYAKEGRKALFLGQAPEALARDVDPADLAKPTSEERVRDPLEMARGMGERRAAKKPGLFQEESAARARAGGFSDMKDDLPWADDRPG